MLSERSANLMSLAAALPRPADGIEPRGSPGIDRRYQWIVRLTTRSLQGGAGEPADRVRRGDVAVRARGVARTQIEARPREPVDLILDRAGRPSGAKS